MVGNKSVFILYIQKFFVKMTHGLNAFVELI